MKISINVSGLKHHLSHLYQELDEINKLFHILDNWEQANPDVSTHFFSAQRSQLVKQRKMIYGRLCVLETLIEEFSRCIYTTDHNIKLSIDTLNHLD